MFQFLKDFIQATITAFVVALLCNILFSIEVSRETILSNILLLMLCRIYAYIFDHEPVYGTYVMKHKDDDSTDDRLN